MYSAKALFLEPDERRPRHGRASIVVLNATIALGYVLTGYIGLKLAFVGNTVTLFWAPSGLAFAAIWLAGRKLAPGVAAGAFAVNFVTGLPALPCLFVAVGNTVAPLVAVELVAWSLGRSAKPTELKRVLWFVLWAVLAATLISATVGTAVVRWLTDLDADKRWTWPVWWSGDAMGVLIAAPPILLWRRLAAAPDRVPHLGHTAAFVATGLALVIAQMLVPEPIWAVELLKLLVLMLSLAAGVRFGLAGPAIVTLLVAIGEVVITAYGAGSFVQGSLYDRLAEVHAFLFATGVGGMLLAAIMADLRRAIASEREAQVALAAASAGRIRMLTMISHDLRTPLGAMTMALATLRSPASEEERAGLIEGGLHAGDTMTTLVNDILATASLDQGHVAIQPVPFDLRASVEHVVSRHRSGAQAKKLALSLRIDGNLPPRLLGDRIRIEQIIDNVIGNAVAYTSTGGIDVACRWLPDLDLEVEVTDTGDGIDPALAPHIFDAFVKADPGSIAGLGLGLHISHRLAGLMGGSLTYAPAAGGGSRFTFTAPLPPATSAAALRATPNAADPIDILLVEDDPISRQITVAWLTNQGHRVAAAANGEDALILARTKPFHLALIDQDLGDGMSGQSVIEGLRLLPAPMANLTVIVLTGADTTTPARLNWGADALMSKPIPLHTDIAGLVERRRAVR